MEIHPDVYNRIPDFEQYAAKELKNSHLAHLIDPSRYGLAVRTQNGMPMDVTLLPENRAQNIFCHKSHLAEILSENNE